MTIAKVLAVYRPRPSSSLWSLRRGRCWSCPSRTCTGQPIGLVMGRGRASSKSIRCLPASLRQASAVRTTAIGLALTPADGVPIGESRWLCTTSSWGRGHPRLGDEVLPYSPTLTAASGGRGGCETATCGHDDARRRPL